MRQNRTRLLKSLPVSNIRGREDGDELLAVETDECCIDKIVDLHHIRHLADITAHAIVDFSTGLSWKHGLYVHAF